MKTASIVKNLILLTLFSVSLMAKAESNSDPFKAVYGKKDYGRPHATGFVRSNRLESFYSKAPRKAFTDTDAAVPGHFSMKRKAGPVEDQGQCGSCWDFALTSTLRGTWISAGKDPGRLSFNYLLNCAKEMQGCEGGDFTAADYFIHPKGAPAYGTDGGYSAYQGACKAEPAVASAVTYHMLGDSKTGPSFKDIAYVVGVLHRPVSVDLAVDDEWQKYSWGVYGNCSDNNGNDVNHMVVIEGYDCEKSVDAQGNCVFDQNGNLPNASGSWVIRNSWGDGWGDSGYIRMKATNYEGKRCDAVATDALYFDIAN